MNKPTEVTLIEIKKILEILPHRYPFILIDRILECNPGESITGIKNVTINENIFQGHFPGEPIYPGVLMAEGMAQTAGILLYESGIINKENKVFFYLGIDKCRFRGIAKPGDQIIFKIEAKRLKAKLSKLICKAYIEEKMVAEAEILLGTVQ